MSFLRTPARQEQKRRVIPVEKVAMLPFILKDTVATVKYEITDGEREGLFDGVPVNDRGVIAQLIVDQAVYQKRVADFNRHTPASIGYFLSRQHG